VIEARQYAAGPLPQAPLEPPSRRGEMRRKSGRVREREGEGGRENLRLDG
jgi:hypothetical protein